MTKPTKRLLSIILSLLMVLSGVIPAFSAFAADGVVGYYDIEIFYSDTDTIVPTYTDDTQETEYVEYMTEGDTLQLTYELIDTTMPDNGYVEWYSETPTLVDVDQTGLVKAFDSSKGAVVRLWIDNEVATIPLIGSALASALEEVLFNDYVDLDSMDTDEIVALVTAAFGSSSILSQYADSYEGTLVDSLEYYLDNINSNIHVVLYDSDGTVLDDDYIQICVEKCEEWYANFLPNGTHITNKSQINTTVAVGSTVQLSAVTTPLRLNYGVIYSVKSSSIFSEGKVVATVDDSGLVTFKNTGTVTIVVSPDTEEIIQGILEMVNYFYALENTGTLDTDEIADILINYVGLDINRTVLAGILDVCFAVYEVAEDTADPVQLTATAVEILSNLILQFVYNDTITFTVVEGEPLEDFSIDGATSVKEGNQIQLSITDISPDAGDTSDITWYSSDPSIASVDPDTGVVTGRDAGGSLGSLSSQQCTIYATSAANNITRSITMTVTGKTGKYLSDAEISGASSVTLGEETDYTYTVYPSRVAESSNLYITWGMVTGEDEDGNNVYSWANSEESVTDGIGTIDCNGHYTATDGGKCTIAMMAQTGYYLSDGSFYEISSFTVTKEVTNGVPIESITIEAVSATSNGTLSDPQTVTINGQEYTYVTIYKGVGEAYYLNGANITATVYPSNASNKTLTWVVDNGYYTTELSDDTLTATVTQNSGHEVADTFNIYAVSEDGEIVSNVITVCVTRNQAVSNVIDQDSIEVVRGNQAEVTHTITFDGSWTSTAYACYKCNWYSSDEDIFTVETQTNDNRDGLITAVDVGTATLYCVTADGGLVATAEVTVYPDKTYLQNIVTLCDKTVIKRTTDNRTLYNAYMKELDIAYTVLYDMDMVSQTVCDTVADDLLYAFYKLGGFVGIIGVDILDSDSSELSSDYVSVSVGSTTNYTKVSYDLNYGVTPSSAMYSSVTWTSSNSSITVDKNGTCTPSENSACSAIITCTLTDYMGSEISDSIYIAFARTKVTGVTLDTTSITGGAIGETQTLTATVYPTGTLGVGAASCDDVYWYSSNDDIATVDENGVVTFVEGGDCVIYCTTYDGGHTAQCAVNVVTNYSALILLIQQLNDLSLNEANYYPDSWEAYQEALSDAQALVDKANSSQDEVDAMYETLNNAYNSLEKYTYIQSIELYLDGEAAEEFYQYDLSLLSEGISYTNASLDLNVRLYPNNASYASVVWESSTTDISVTSEGVCSPTVDSSCYGMITCTVTDHFGNVFTDTVWVSFSYYPVTSLELSDTSISGAIGDTYQLTCTVYPTGTSLLHIGAASIQDYYWECDNEEIATIDENGLVTFVSAGATTVRAVSYDGGIYAECTVSTEGDRSYLKELLEEYADVDYQDYEYEYGTAFKEAYDAATAAMTDNTLTQDEIDEIADALAEAYSTMILYPFTKAESVTVTYTTYKKPLVGSASSVTSGTVGSGNSLSIDLSSSYSNYNNYNYVTLTAAAYPTDAMYSSIDWSVNSSSGMDVSYGDGSITLTPTSTGTGAWAKLTVVITDQYSRTVSRDITVVMSDDVCTGFEIDESSLTMLATDDAYQLNYTISGDPEFTDIVWTSSDESVATVDENGAITPVEKGSATITAKTVDGGYTDTVSVEVQTDFSTLASKYSEYYNLIQSVKDSYTYTEDSLDVLSTYVSQAQTMINNGSATQAEVEELITLLDDAYNSLVEYNAATGVTIGFEESDYVSLVNEGFIRYTATSINSKSVTLTADVEPTDAIYTSITWESSNSNITIDEDGILTNNAAAAGVTLVTCTIENAKGETYSSSVYVSFVRYGATVISFADEYVFGAPAQTVTLSPTITNSNGSSLASSIVTDCIYESDDESVATVDSDGVVTFISQGTATITATALDGGYTATIIAYTTWDTTALAAALEEAEGITYTDYAYEYGTAFKEAYDTAVDVYADVYATQDEIDSACTALTEAMANLEGNEFIEAEAALTCDGTTLSDGDMIQVDTDTMSAVIELSVNDDAMVQSVEMSYSDASGVEAVLEDTSLTVTLTDETGSITVTVTITDDYGTVTEESYTFSVIEEVIPVTAIDLTVNGETLDSSSYVCSCGGTYTNYEELTVGYIATPEDANAVTDVSYTSSASSYITVDSDGTIELTTIAKARSSNTATITCTVTNSDGTQVTASFTLTITRA